MINKIVSFTFFIKKYNRYQQLYVDQKREKKSMVLCGKRPLHGVHSALKAMVPMLWGSLR